MHTAVVTTSYPQLTTCELICSNWNSHKWELISSGAIALISASTTIGRTIVSATLSWTVTAALIACAALSYFLFKLLGDPEMPPITTAITPILPPQQPTPPPIPPRSPSPTPIPRTAPSQPSPPPQPWHAETTTKIFNIWEQLKTNLYDTWEHPENHLIAQMIPGVATALLAQYIS